MASVAPNAQWKMSKISFDKWYLIYLFPFSKVFCVFQTVTFSAEFLHCALMKGVHVILNREDANKDETRKFDGKKLSSNSYFDG